MIDVKYNLKIVRHLRIRTYHYLWQRMFFEIQYGIFLDLQTKDNPNIEKRKSNKNVSKKYIDFNA